MCSSESSAVSNLHYMILFWFLVLFLFLFYIIRQVDDDRGKGSSSTCSKTVSERLEEEVLDAKN